MTLTIDGSPIRLYPEIAMMIVALIDHQGPIRKQGTGMVSFEYHGLDVVFKLSRLNYSSKIRKLPEG